MLETSILLGGLTHHILASDLPYCNTVNSKGSIYNPYVIALSGSKTTKGGVIAGKDSACGNIFGLVGSQNIYKNVELVIGGYNTNHEKFKERKIKPPKAFGFTPIVGIDYRIPLAKNVSLDNLISYGIVTHAIRWDF